MPAPEPFAAMQAAVDIVGQSPHPTNKVAAAIAKDAVVLSRSNFWPAPILKAFGTDTKIGNSSGTIHAETACILSFPGATQDADFFITDPPCPNCAKNIAESGVKALYIDHKGFDKDFFHRRAGHFETMSMKIFEKAGLAVYQIWRKEERIVPIFTPPQGYVPPEDNPVRESALQSIADAAYASLIEDAARFYKDQRFAVAIVKNESGALFSIMACGHTVTGYTLNDPADAQQVLEQREEKYSFFQEPVNRLLMYMARKGYRIHDDLLFCSQVPTSREQVNMIGAGLHKITIGNVQKSRDPEGLVALRQLSESEILHYSLL